MGKAIELPGLAALNKNKYAQVLSMSCAPAGTCSAGGFYADRHDHEQGFAATERNGHWSTPIQIPG